MSQSAKASWPTRIVILGAIATGLGAWYYIETIKTPPDLNALMLAPRESSERSIELLTMISDGQRADADGDYEPALTLYNRVIELTSPEKDGNYYWPAQSGAANVEMQLKRFDDALVRYERMAKEAEELGMKGDARVGIAKTTGMSGKLDLSVKLFEEIIVEFQAANRPAVCGSALMAQAHVFRTHKRYGPMRAALERVIEDFPGFEGSLADAARIVLENLERSLSAEEEAQIQALLDEGNAHALRSIEAGQTVTLTKAGGPYLVRAEITVPADSIVKIEAGTELRFGMSGGFHVKGQIEAIGTADAPIRCLPLNPSEEAGQTWWKGFRFEDNGSAGASVLTHVQCVGAEAALACANGAVTATRCDFEKSARFGVLCETDGVITLNDCRITNGGYVGVRCEQGGVVKMTGGLVAEQYRNGIVVALAKEGIAIKGTVVENNGIDGVIFRDAGGGSLIDCTIRGNQGAGVRCRGGAKPTITACIITGNLAEGIACSDRSEPIVNGTTIKENKGGGISFDQGCSGAVKGSTITGNAVFGLRCTLSEIAIEGNRITGNAGPGIWIAQGGNPAVHQNDLTGNEGPALRNHSSNTIAAEQNWWGTTDPGEIAKLVEDADDDGQWGQVTVEPALAAAPKARE